MTRTYRMVARAAAAEETGRRILAAARELFGELLYDQVSLQAVAARANVTVQTVLRRFTSKEQLFAAVAARKSEQIRGARDQAPVGDVGGAVANLIAVYEAWADDVLHLLAQESRTRAIRTVTVSGRHYHHAWVERVFAPLLRDLPAGGRQQRLAQLIVVTDLYTWKILRRDLGLSPEQLAVTMEDMIRRLLA